MKNYVFGIDIGGTTVKLGLFTTTGVLRDKWEIPTRTMEAGTHILPDVAASVRAKLAEQGIDAGDVAGMGIDVPGPVDSSGTVQGCVNLGWGVFNVKQEMNRLLPEIPNVVAGNDANVAALGELADGGGKGYDSAVMFTLGTGVGGGIIVDGRIIAGRNGGAGELGHITVEPGETEACGCGKRGCLEQYASANGIVKLAKRMLAACDTPSPLRELQAFNSKHICDLAREGDAMAAAIVDKFGDYLGRAMSYVACTVDPDVFIIGGGLSKAGEIIVDAITQHYTKYAFHVSAHTPIVIARLGNDAGIYGAMRMALT